MMAWRYVSDPDNGANLLVWEHLLISEHPEAKHGAKEWTKGEDSTILLSEIERELRWKPIEHGQRISFHDVLDCNCKQGNSVENGESHSQSQSDEEHRVQRSSLELELVFWTGMKLQELDVVQVVVVLACIPMIPLQISRNLQWNQLSDNWENWLKRQNDQAKRQLWPNVWVPSGTKVAITSTFTKSQIPKAILPISWEIGLQEDWHHACIQDQAQEYGKAYKHPLVSCKVRADQTCQGLCDSDEGKIR